MVDKNDIINPKNVFSELYRTSIITLTIKSKIFLVSFHSKCFLMQYGFKDSDWNFCIRGCVH